METTTIDMENQQALRVSGRMPPEYYERNPVFDHEYIGPRFTYGLVNAEYRVSTVPKGEIQNSYKPEENKFGSIYGTIEYPYALTEEQISIFKLIDIQRKQIELNQALQNDNRKKAIAWERLGEAVAFNLPPNCSIIKPTQADFKYSANKLEISTANAIRAWHYKMGNIEIPKTNAPEITNKVNYDTAVYEKETGKVIAIFVNPSSAQNYINDFHNKDFETQNVSPEIYKAFFEGKTIYKNKNGIMEIQTQTIDPAAEKYMQDRQRHNDQAEEHNRLRKLGQDVVPGIRFQDAADAGRVYEMKKKGQLSQAEWNDYVNELDKSGKAAIPKEYVIYSKAESVIQDIHSFWSNKNGWTSLDDATRFTEFQLSNMPDPDGFAIKHSIAQKLDNYITFGSSIDFSKLQERMDELNKNADSASDALGILETQFQSETNLFGDAGTGQSEDISRIKKLMNEMESEWKVLNNLEVSFETYNHLNKNNEFKTIKSDKNDFADFVNTYNENHVKGYSPKESVLNINSVAKKQGLNSKWTYKEDNLYGVIIEGKFTKDDSSNIGVTNITKDGKAIFFYNNERIDGYYASNDPETQEAAIQEIAKSISEIYKPEFTFSIIPGIDEHLVKIKESGRSIGHIEAGTIDKFNAGDYSTFKPFQNWKLTFSKKLQEYLKLNDQTIAVGEVANNELNDYEKIRILATTLAKAETVLSYNEISTFTGLNKDDIENHWTVASNISDKAKERSEKHNGNTEYKDIEYEINFLTFRHFNNDKDKQILENLSFIFPEEKQDQDGEVTIELVKPSDANSPYEVVTIRPILNDDENILPENSFNVKHYVGIPAQRSITDSEQIKHEFTFSVDDNYVYAYWMQNGQIYKDALRDFGGQFYDTPENIKDDLLDFTTRMKEQIIAKTATEAPQDKLTDLYIQGREAGQYAVKNDLRGKELAAVQWKHPRAIDMYHHGFTDGVLETITPANNSDLQFIKDNNKNRGIINKGEQTMFIHTENSFDEFRAVVLAVARYNVDPQTGEKIDTYAELKKRGFSDEVLNKYHTEAVKLVDETISADLRPNSYSLIQTMHGRVWDHYDKIRGDNYIDKAYENMPLQNGDLATGEVSKNSMDTYYKAIDKDGNEYVTNEMPLNKYLYNPVQTEQIHDIEKPILDKDLVETLANKYVSVNIIDKQTLLATINEYPETPMKKERISEIYSYLSREEANILSNFSADHKEFYEKLMVVDKNQSIENQVPRDIRDISMEIQRNMIVLDKSFFDKAFTHGDNTLVAIPADIRNTAEVICITNKIKGTSDPMYIANVTALELGRGDGMSHFATVRSTTIEDIDRLAARINSAYRSNIIDPATTKDTIVKYCSHSIMTHEQIKENYKYAVTVKEKSGTEILYGFDSKEEIEKIWEDKYKESLQQNGWNSYSIVENQKQEAKYFAVDHDKNEIIAEGITIKECSDKAAIASNWNQEPGSHAPYSITNKDGAELFTKTLPNLSKEEREEYTTFVDVMKQNYPDIKIEDVNKLCGIAHEMAKCNIARSTEHGMTEEKFIEVTDRQEVQIDSILKQAQPTPGLSLDYEPRGAAIKLELPQGQRNNISGYAVPEIPIQKLTATQTHKIQQTQNITRK